MSNVRTAILYGIGLCLVLLVIPLVVLATHPPKSPGKSVAAAKPALQLVASPGPRHAAAFQMGLGAPPTTAPAPAVAPPVAAAAPPVSTTVAVHKATTTTTTKPAVKAATTTTTAAPAAPAARTVQAAGSSSESTAVAEGDSGSGATTGEATWFHAPDGTCAHRTLPMGTVLTVTRVSTGQSTTCVVADRGPFVSGVIVDLSMDTFANIASPSEGSVEVSITW